MRNNKIGKVAVGIDGVGTHKFDLSHDVNTTMEFGDVEPLFVHEMMANSSMRVKAENLTRLAPLVAPCFGRMKYHNYNLFVKKSDIFPLYDAWQSQKPTAGASATGNVGIPTKLPHITNNKLFANCFVGADYQHSATPTATAGMYSNGPYYSNIKWTYRKVAGNSSSRWKTTIFANDMKPTATSWLPDVGALSSSTISNPYAYNLCWFIGRYYNASGNTPEQQAYLPAPAGNFHINEDGDSNSDSDPLFVQDSADYTLYGHNPTAQSWGTATQAFAHSFRFSNYGRRFAKILAVCGYALDLENDSEVSILPLLAYYRAYFELFGIQLYKNWESTPAYQLIQRFRYVDGDSAFHDLNPLWYDRDSILWKFLRDLTNCWVSDEQDVVSAATKDGSGYGLGLASNNVYSINNFLEHGSKLLRTKLGSNTEYLENVVRNDVSTGGAGTSAVGGSAWGGPESPNDPDYTASQVKQVYISRMQHSELDAKLLRKAYKYVNRQTILGQNIAKTLNAMGQEHYDEDVPCPFIGHLSIPLSVSDVTSLADTSASGGRSLGEFGGKAVGYNQGKSFKWKADCDGYWISFSAIIPEAGYCQQMDKTLQNLDKYSCYQPDFERTGMVVQQKSQVVGSVYSSIQLQSFNRFGSTTNLANSSPLSVRHGFVPRYTEYKTARNVISGDFARGATMDTYAPYHLDKLIPVGRRQLGYDAETHSTTNTIKSDVVTADMLPMAGTSWRFSSRYPWLSNFSRIFANVGTTPNNPKGFNISLIQDMSGNSEGWSFDCLTQNDDNFICHNVLLVTYNAPMLPISDSYEAFEEDKGANGSATKA